MSIFKKFLLVCLVIIAGITHADKVAVIGSGPAGLTSAWLLGKAGHEVTLIEKEGRLGGHANSVEVELDGKKYISEAGAEYFNTTSYSHFLRLLEYLGVTVAGFSLVTTFFNPKNNSRLVVPPVHDKKIEWHSFTPSNLWNMIRLKYVIYSAKTIMTNKDPSLAFETFLNTLRLSDGFKDFLYLNLGAAFGVDAETAKTMKAYYALRYMIDGEHTQWLEATEGLKSYVEKMAKEIIADGSKIETGVGVNKISSLEKGGYRIKKEDGTQAEFDKVVIATSASTTARILESMQEKEEFVNVLNQVNYVPATIAIHGDEKYLPPDPKHRKLINVCTQPDGQSARMTMQKHLDIPIYKSWVDKANLPNPCYSIHDYEHIVVNQNYVDAQQAVKLQQGKDNLFFAGTWTQNGDSHEEAIISGMNVAEKIGANPERLAILKGEEVKSTPRSQPVSLIQATL